VTLLGLGVDLPRVGRPAWGRTKAYGVMKYHPNRHGIFVVLAGMNLTRTTTSTRNVKLMALAAVAACALSAAAPAAADAADAAGAAAAAPRFLPVSASWPTPQRGVVLGYASRTAGARPYLYQTGDGGHQWQRLAAPPVRYPADQDQPAVTWAKGMIAVTNGARIVVTRDGGRRWSAVRLAGVPAPSRTSFVHDLTITDGRMFALVDQTDTKTGTGSSALYSGPARGQVLRPVPRLSITGDFTYSTISSAGGALQIDLGHDYSAQRYWYSRNGLRFTPGPLPCPAPMVTFPGATPGGRPVALCATPPSAVGLGTDETQVRTAAHLGGAFRASGPLAESPNALDFAVASARDMAMDNGFSVMVTFNGGRKWVSPLSNANGGEWTSLAFLSATTGVVVDNTISNSGKPEGAVYRTTDSGHVWHALRLP
jgi:hypothetical protein